jgi:hypothetical protein
MAPMRNSRAHQAVVAALAAVLAMACNKQPPPAASLPSSHHVLDGSEASIIILETLMGYNIDTHRGWSVDIASEAPLDVSFRIAATPYGIAWVGPQEVEDHGLALPDPDQTDRLLILPGHGEDADARILILDHRNYRYEQDADRVRGGARGRGEAEGRLRRDVRDFVAHVRAEGALVTPP